MRSKIIRQLEFTPLEFETNQDGHTHKFQKKLEFTPLEFETYCKR